MFDLPPHITWDLETGGLNHRRCALLSIAVTASWSGELLHLYVLPEGDVDAQAAKVNGYTPELWAERGAVSLKEALFIVQCWLHNVRRWLHIQDRRCLVNAAHNAGFESLFLQAAQERTGIDLQLPPGWECSKLRLQDARDFGLLPAGSNHLNDLGELSGFWAAEKREAAHDALQDARCCAHGLLWLSLLTAPRRREKKNTPPRTRPVGVTQRQRLERSLNHLEKTVHQFVERLAPVLAAEVENGGAAQSAACAPVPGTSGIANDFNQAAGHADYLISRLTHTLRRLELPELIKDSCAPTTTCGTSR